MTRRRLNFDDLVSYVYGGKIRFSGCNARKQRAKYEELLSDPKQQQKLHSGWERWEAIKEACMCHTSDGIIRRLYEFFSCFEGQFATNQYQNDLDCILERRGTNYQEKVGLARRVLQQLSPDNSNVVDDVVQEIERNARPTVFWFLLKSPNATEQEIMSAYKQFAFSKTTTKLVAPLFIWMWRTIEMLAKDRLSLLQITREVLSSSYNQKTVTHLVPMKLLKESKRVTKELKRVLSLRGFETDVSSRKFPEEIVSILDDEIAELRKRKFIKTEKNRVEEVEEDDEKEYAPHEYALFNQYSMNQENCPPFYHETERLDLDDVDLTLPSMALPESHPPINTYAYDFGNAPYMVEHDERVEVMPSKKEEPSDWMPEEEEKQVLGFAAGVPVTTPFGAPAPFEHPYNPPRQRSPVPFMDDDEDVEMTGFDRFDLPPPVESFKSHHWPSQYPMEMPLSLSDLPPPPPLDISATTNNGFMGFGGLDEQSSVNVSPEFGSLPPIAPPSFKFPAFDPPNFPYEKSFNGLSQSSYERVPQFMDEETQHSFDNTSAMSPPETPMPPLMPNRFDFGRFGFIDDSGSSNHQNLNGLPSNFSSFPELTPNQFGFNPPSPMFNSSQLNPVAASETNPFGGFRAFDAGYFADTSLGEDGGTSNRKMLDSGEMDVDFFNKSMDVDHPPPVSDRHVINAGENDLSSFSLRNNNTIISGGSTQNDPFGVNQEYQI